jgi:hypothetical protein
VAPQAVQSLGAQWKIFVEQLRAIRPALVVLDTQARVTVGVNENDAGEMGQAINAWEAVREATGACVLVVHHRGIAGGRGRGSTAVYGAMTTELDVSRAGPNITVETTKQKDAPEASPLVLTMNALGESIVLVAASERAATGPFTSPPPVELSTREKAAHAICRALLEARGSGLTKAEALTHARLAMGMAPSDLLRKTVRRAWADMVGLGRISKAVGREAYFWVNVEGIGILDANPDKMVSGGPEIYVPPTVS